ncbi:hypothetical protein [Clostridium grantii]|nr:hypothetical protein [Clostridium grantii]
MKKLRDYSNNKNFIENIRTAFTTLKDDVSLELNTSRQAIKELKELHVDNNNYLSKLIQNSKKSSGIIYGERGTGKTHLFLLANEEINSKISEHKVLSIYLNLKEISFPKETDTELFNRIYSIHIYEQIYSQLIRLLRDKEASNLLEQIKLIFSKEEKEFIKRIRRCLLKLIDFKNVCFWGNKEFQNIDTGIISKESSSKYLEEICEILNARIDNKKLSISYEELEKYSKESSDKLSKQSSFISYLNVNEVKKNLVELSNILELNSITFYIDEWEKLYNISKLQEYSASYIDKLNGNPIYFWIAYVPWRGSLYNLVAGADLPHNINLDTSLIFEESIKDKQKCLVYFKEFINKRIGKYIVDYNLDYSSLFVSDKVFEQLVISSMGNSREFGLMLVESIDNWIIDTQKEIVTHNSPKAIGLNIVKKSIITNGNTKKRNIEKYENSLKLLRDIEKFCFEKESSHFAIIINKDTIEMLNRDEFSELFYQRLIHLRKRDVAEKDGQTEIRLNIYSVDYSSTYNFHKNKKKFSFFLNGNEIHNKARRYVYTPSNILQNIDIMEGESFKCKNCKTVINIKKAKMAWEKNTCPNCWEKLYND